MNVYVGDYAEYVIPQDIYQKALDMNNGKRLSDMRTKGAKYLDWWGRSQDATEFTKLALVKNFNLVTN